MKKFFMLTFIVVMLVVSNSCKKAVVPTVITGDADDIQYKTATLHGEVSDNGGADITARGFYYNTSNDLNEGSAGVVKVEAGTGDGAFSVELDGLSPNTKYYYKAYAVNEAGTSDGQVKEFTTLTK